MTAEGEVPLRWLGTVGDRNVAFDFSEKPGEKFVEDLRAPRQQRMAVMTLWNPAPVDRLIRQHVAIDNCHGPVEVGEHPRSEQSAHAGAKYHGVVAEAVCRRPVNLPHQEPPQLVSCRGCWAGSGA